MGIKTIVARWLAKRVHKQTQEWSRNPEAIQKKIFSELIGTGSQTLFGEDHDFSYIKSHKDFREAVPVRDYEGLKPYVSKILEGGDDILWKGKPLYFAKTSGTTSGVKYIPITVDSMPNHIDSARNALLSYVYETNDTRLLGGKLIFLSGSPSLDEKCGIKTGRLSGIVNHHVPGYLRTNQLPSYNTNIIEDWEEKLGRIVEETINQDMRLISGIPPWMQMYFDWLTERSGKKIGELFPNLSLIVYGGVNFEPYREKLFKSIGKKVSSIETFPASEGFFAYQDRQDEEGLLLQLNSGIFYEFIPASEVFNEHPTRLTIKDVELGVNYALIINSNAGLWGYNIGDTVKFVSKNPYKLVVTGRIKHYISAFGEHVIAEEVELCLAEAARETKAEIIEFTVAPEINPGTGEMPYHEWFIEFAQMPDNLENFRMRLDDKMRKKNIYYNDLIEGRILRPLMVTPVQKGTFINYMKSQGKLGGQNKLPRLSNDRKIADAIQAYILVPNKV